MPHAIAAAIAYMSDVKLVGPWRHQGRHDRTCHAVACRIGAHDFNQVAMSLMDGR
jgi:hypothetical protein